MDETTLALILLGRVPDLLSTRGQVLRLSGFLVFPADNIQRVLRLLEGRTVFDGVVICHSFSVAEQLQIRRRLQVVSPGLAVMLMSSKDDNSPKKFVQRTHRFFAAASINARSQAA